MASVGKIFPIAGNISNENGCLHLVPILYEKKPVGSLYAATEGVNLQIDYGFGTADPARLNSYAEELVRLSPDVIVAGDKSCAAADANDPDRFRGGHCVHAFERYLREERVLATATIVNYVRFIREFLKDCFGNAYGSELRSTEGCQA